MVRTDLHPVQKALLEILRANIDDPLTIQQLKDQLGVSSKSVVAHHIAQLEKKLYLKRNPGDSRDYEILRDGPEKQVTYLNLYGLAHCGRTGSILDDAPIDRIPVSSRLLPFPAGEGFLVRAKGDSMFPRIQDRDLVIARRAQDVESGSIAVCINDGEALIKKVLKEISGCLLVSLNQKFTPFSASEDFRIVGKVTGLFGYTTTE